MSILKEELYRDFINEMNSFSNNIAFTYYDQNDNIYEKTYADFIDDINDAIEFLSDNHISERRIAFCCRNSYQYMVLSLACVFCNNRILLVDNTSKEIIDSIKKKYSVDCIVTEEILDGNLFYREKNGMHLNFISNFPKYDSADEISDFFLFTSGSTGKPKAVLISGQNMFLAASYIAQNFSPYPNTLLVLPMNHIYGYCAITLSHLFRGENIIISNGIKYLNREMKKFNPYTIFMVPTMLYSYYDLGLSKVGDKSEIFGNRLKTLYCGGGKLESDYIRKYREYNIEVLNGYGITEMCGCISIMHEGTEYLDSVGKPYDGVEIRIENGEILINSPYHFEGYYDGDKIENVIEDGCYHTHDEGYFIDGHLHVTGRRDNIFVLPNGKNIYSPELIGKFKRIKGVADAKISVVENKLVAEILYSRGDCFSVIKEQVEKMNNELPGYMKFNEIKWSECDDK